MTVFPTMLYRSPGPHKLPAGGTYFYIGAQTQEEFDEKIEAGWFSSSEQAIEAAGDKATTPKRVADWRIKLKAKKTKKRKASKPLGWKQTLTKEETVQVDAPPTRTELETKATELSIHFDGRTRDKRLGQLIQDKLSATPGE